MTGPSGKARPEAISVKRDAWLVLNRNARGERLVEDNAGAM